MDIVGIIQQFCNFQLTDWQKEYVQKLYEAEMEEKHLIYIYIPPRSASRHTTESCTHWLFL